MPMLMPTCTVDYGCIVEVISRLSFRYSKAKNVDLLFCGSSALSIAFPARSVSLSTLFIGRLLSALPILHQ